MKGFYCGLDIEKVNKVLSFFYVYFFKNGYLPIDTPTVLPAKTFSCAGEASEIVHKQMYKLSLDKSEEYVLRPEGTMPVVSYVKNKKMDSQGASVKLFYAQKMFRHERTQKLRRREFTQLGVELFNASLNECILSLLPALELFESRANELEIFFNYIGSREELLSYAAMIQKQALNLNLKLTEITAAKVNASPMGALKIFDSKSELDQTAAKLLPDIFSTLSQSSQLKAEQFVAHLSALTKIKITRSPHVVRGLDYYRGAVFEVYDHVQKTTLIGGGEYLENGFGYALGVERALRFVELANYYQLGVILVEHNSPDLLFYYAKSVRPILNQIDDLRVQLLPSRTFSGALKRANHNLAAGKLNAVLILGTQESKARSVRIITQLNTKITEINLDALYEYIKKSNTSVS